MQRTLFASLSDCKRVQLKLPCRAGCCAMSFAKRCARSCGVRRCCWNGGFHSYWNGGFRCCWNGGVSSRAHCHANGWSGSYGWNWLSGANQYCGRQTFSHGVADCALPAVPLHGCFLNCCPLAWSLLLSFKVRWGGVPNSCARWPRMQRPGIGLHLAVVVSRRGGARRAKT